MKYDSESAVHPMSESHAQNPTMDWFAEQLRLEEAGKPMEDRSCLSCALENFRGFLKSFRTRIGAQCPNLGTFR